MSAGAPVLFVAEPPAQYLVRPPVVIDCSVIAALLFREVGESQALAQMTGRALHGPFLLAVEMASVALKKQQAGYFELAKRGLLLFEETELKFHAVKSSGVLELASQYQLTSYDASYLWLAAELKCPLLTFDASLGKAAAVHLNALS
jgi:predicted nucleic acid-binding protein